MTTLTIHVGESLDAMEDRVRMAARRAEAGASVQEDHLSFDSFETLARLLTPARLALLRHLHRHPTATVDVLAQQLGRDRRLVAADVEALAAAGLVDLAEDGAGLSAPYDDLTARIAL